ncbi:swi5-dependent recombination DNA repair protein 1 homolog isoform X2 [Ostrea edulis]|nr:swi5-dependent recombination DNA repair protein 1 homolog isoform X2 [Ostrea edulis]
MSSGLKERLKRCGRYHSSPIAGQKSHKRSHFDSPLLMSSDKGEIGESTGTGSCELQSNIVNLDTSNSCASMTFHGRLEKQSTENDNVTNSEIHRVTPCTNDGTISKISDSVKPKRLDFSKNQICDTKFSSSAVTYKTDYRDSQKRDLEKSRLQSLIKDREDTLRKLKLVQFYQHKHDQNKMEELIRKWHQVCQEGLVDLLQLMPEPKPTLTELIDHLGIDHSMISFNKEDQSFTDYVG